MSPATDTDHPPGAIAFEVLGPVAVVGDGRRAQLRAHRQRAILATLLLAANRVVSSERLIDAVWEDAPPATARSQVHICVSAIRGLLREFGGADPIETGPSGYLIRIQPGQLDSHRFEQLTTEATGLAQRGQLAEAVAVARRALDLWRGPALDGLNSSTIATRATRLDEDRLVALESCADWGLRLGRGRELISELAERVAAHPLRERSRAQLMLALHRSGRQAEALEVYRDGRRELIGLGLEPGDELRRMETLILANDPELMVGEQAPVVLAPARQLPADIADFVGRADLVDRLTGLLADSAAHDAVPVVVASGIGGVGKSALAVHTAHLLARSPFTDGQLYADLGGSLAHPRGPGEVLSRFLRALGVFHTAIPDNVDERAELYRSLLADRRMLVVLEDVGTEDQVRLLLPGSSTCGVLITSRAKLVGLAGARVVDVPGFGERDAADLLGRIAGQDRVATERAEVAELTRLVGGLPLGLRIIGSRLAVRPHWTLQQLARRLADEGHRLDELAHGDLGVRATISLTYQGLPDRERLLLRLLCDFDTDGFPDWLAAAVLDIDQFDASELLENLVEAQLVDVTAGGAGVPAHYRTHELVRIFAREQAANDPAEQRAAALARVCGGWLSLAELAHQQLYGGQFTVMHGSAARWPVRLAAVEPLRWLDVERTNLCAAVRQSAAAGLDELSWDLAMMLVTLFEARAYVDEWEETHRVALAATRAAENRRGEAAMLCSLGSLYVSRGQTEQAKSVLIPALRTFMALDDPHGRALAARNIATVHYQEGELNQAQARYQQALADFRLLGDRVGEAHVLINLARIDLVTGRPDDAIAQLEDALRLSRQAGHRRTEAQALHRMGEAQLAKGRAKDAGHTLRSGLALVRTSGDRIGQMHTLHALGRTHLALGQLENAEYCLREALAIACEAADRLAITQLQPDLATVLARRGAYDGVASA
ncbi:MAG TPA: BTAD domain-containing putative transcriptional regulator [Pseudonocardiaceae bacterium]